MFDDKTLITTPTPNINWTQQTEIDDHHNMSSSSTPHRVMEKPEQQNILQQQQQQLKCPRCDSSNTKFCYYNNYSLSQPRHFCKACKRYWTRGGTLRNVPVGGGCRKNKRVKRSTHSSSNIDTPSPSSNTPTHSISNPPSSFDIGSASNHINSLLYGGDVLNFPFSTRFNYSTRGSNSSVVSGFDLQQGEINDLGLGFSSGLVNLNSNHHLDGDYRNGFSSNHNNYSSIFGSGSCSTTTPVMASLLNSTLLQQKFMSTSTGGGVFGHHEMVSKDEKLVEENRLDQWNDNNNMSANGGVGFQNQMENMGLSDSSSSLYWNNNNNTTTTNLGGSVWSNDQANTNNIGPNSVTSLI